MMSVSIIIPTMRRPAPLDRALRSAAAQTSDGVSVEVVIVDNDPQASARHVVEQLAVASPVPVRYVHSPEPGVANARNAGVQASQGDFIAFLDDDEEAPDGWLDALLQVQAQFEADAVFGPVHARIPEIVVHHRIYFEAFFSRFGPAAACTLSAGVGCGCSLVRRGALPDQRTPFCATRNGTGGEDDLLFAEMKARKARFAWAPEAWVWEDPEPSRLALGYTLKRAFTYGQGPTTAAYTRGPSGWPMVFVWMAVGAAQTAVHGAAAVLHALRRSSRLATSLDRTARGVGKVVWFPPFKIGFYGRAALDRQLRRDAAASDQSQCGDEPRARRQMLDVQAVG